MARNSRRRDRWPKRLLERGARPFVRRPRMDLRAIMATDPRRILVVRQHDQLGDMLCALPALRTLRQNFPQARLGLVTAPAHHAVVRHHPDLDAVLLYDKRATRLSPRTSLRFVRALRAFDADLAFVLNSVSFSSTSAWLAVLSGAPLLVGGDSVPFGWSFSRWLYSLEMPTLPQADRHAIEHGLQPLASIGLDVADRSVRIVPGPQAEARALAFLASLPEGAPIAALHPGAGKPENRWPPARFARAIEALEREGARVFLIEGPVDVAAVRETFAALGSERPVLREVDAAVVAAALARCSAVLVNDTGIMHVAGAVDAPTVALFGPTRATQWAPPSPELVALQSPGGNMDGLSVDLVLATLREKLQRGRTQRPR